MLQANSCTGEVASELASWLPSMELSQLADFNAVLNGVLLTSGNDGRITVFKNKEWSHLFRRRFIRCYGHVNCIVSKLY